MHIAILQCIPSKLKKKISLDVIFPLICPSFSYPSSRITYTLCDLLSPWLSPETILVKFFNPTSLIKTTFNKNNCVVHTAKSKSQFSDLPILDFSAALDMLTIPSFLKPFIHLASRTPFSLLLPKPQWQLPFHPFIAFLFLSNLFKLKRLLGTFWPFLLAVFIPSWSHSDPCL